MSRDTLDARQETLGRRLVEEGLVPVEALATCREEVLARRAAGQVAMLEKVLLERRLVDAQALGRILRELTDDPSLGAGPDGYRDLEPIGEGSGARVYRALDQQLQRTVALKILKDRPGHVTVQRFLREARSIARLQHPNVVRVYQVGEGSTGPFLAMEWIEGRPLDRLLKEGRTALPALVGILEDVARGVQHAHEHRIVHRDLKPANVLVAADGRAKVVDFGLARVEDGETALTRSDAFLGTPLYMSPEQVLGGEVTPATDVHAIGAMLYEILTGRPPHTATGLPELVHKIAYVEPAPPRDLAPGRVPAALEAIALQALRKEPGRRYASAGALADDLRRWSEGARVGAPWLGAVRRGRRWLARRYGTLLAAGAVAASLGVAVRERLERQAAEPPPADAGLEPARPDEEARGVHREGVALEAQGRTRQAERVYRRVIAAAPDLQEARVRLSRLLVRRAIAALLGRRPFEVLPMRGWIERLLLEVRGALPVGSEGEPILLLARGIRAHAGSAREDLRDAVREGLERFDASSWAVEFACLQTLLAGTDSTAGRAVLDPLLDSNRGDALAWLARASFQSRPEPIVADLTEAIRLEPEMAPALARRGHVRRALGEPGGIEDLDAAIAIDPDDPWARHDRGSARFRSGDLPGALEDLGAAIRAVPDFAQAIANRGLVRESLGDLDAAHADFALAIRFDPGLAAAYHDLARMEVRRGAIEAALQAWAEAIRLAPANAVYVYARALARRDAGDRAGAIDDLELASRVDPGFHEAWGERSYLRSLEGDLARALQEVEEAVRLDPRWRPLRALLLARRLRAEGDLAGALEEVRVARTAAAGSRIAIEAKALEEEILAEGR